MLSTYIYRIPYTRWRLSRNEMWEGLFSFLRWLNWVWRRIFCLYSVENWSNFNIFYLFFSIWFKLIQITIIKYVYLVCKCEMRRDKERPVEWKQPFFSILNGAKILRSFFSHCTGWISILWQHLILLAIILFLIDNFDFAK